MPYILKNTELYGFDAYVLCPHMASGWYNENQKQWATGRGMDQLTKLLDKIIEEYNIDRDNIILGGTSMGGGSAIWIAQNMSQYFSKLVVNSANDYSVKLDEIKIPVRGHYGTGEPEIISDFMSGKFKNQFGSENTIQINGANHDDVPGMAYNQDNNSNHCSDLIEWMFDDYSGPTTGRPGGNSDRNEDEEFEDIISPTTGLDTYTGLFIEPTVEFFTFLIDSVMSVISSFMTQSELEFVMVDDIEKITDLGEATTTITIENMEPYETASGNLKLSYPNFKYTPEEIFAGKLDILNVNFIKASNDDDNWNKIRSIISQWYQVLRMVAIIGLLSVLIYTGIKIILSSNTKDKAKYKEMIANWFIAVILAFSMHYIMAFILSIIEEIMGLLKQITGVLEIHAGEDVFKTNLLGYARFQMQQQQFTAKVGHLVIYSALIAFTFKFTFVYLKRVIMMAFLTVISPIVALTYPIDKMEGKAKGFEMWIKEFTFNALLQPMHYILYYILVSTSLTLAVRNPLYAIAALMFMTQAEKMLKKIFGFGKAKEGTVGGIAGAFTTGAVTSALMNGIRDPLHPFSGGKSKGKGKSGGKGTKSTQSSQDIDDENISGILEDTDFENLLNSGMVANYDVDINNNQSNASERRTQINPSYSISELYDKPLINLADDLYTAMQLSKDMSLSEEERQYYAEKAEVISDVWNKRFGNKSTQYESGNAFDTEASSGNAGSQEFPQYSIKELYGKSKGDFADEFNNAIELSQDMSLPKEQREYYARKAEMMNDIWNERFGEPFEQYEQVNKTRQRKEQNKTKAANRFNHSYSRKELYGKTRTKFADELNTAMDLSKDMSLSKQERQYYLQKAETMKDVWKERFGEPFEQDAQRENLENKSTNEQKESPKQTQNEVQKENENPVSPSYSIKELYDKPMINLADALYKTRKLTKNKSLSKEEREYYKQKVEVMKNVWQNRFGNIPVQENEDEEVKPQSRVVKGVKHATKTIVKPVWDSEKDDEYNAKRLVGNIIKGAAGVTVGIAAATVQAGISITDGKYKPIEGVATIGAGIAGVSALGKGDGKIRKAFMGDEEQDIEEYGKQWFNRDDVISYYNREFPGQGKSMRERAVNNYISRGIIDVKEQKQAMKYANILKKQRGIDEEEADKIAVATLQYRQNLTRNGNYRILFDEDKRKKYLDIQADVYTGSASKDSVRRLHDDLIENVREFDEANR